MGKLQIIVLLTIIILGNSCKKKSDPTLVVGQNYQGGIIAYIDRSGKHGLIAAKNDINQMCVWGCQGKFIGTSLSYGQGQINTNKIISGCTDVNSAANKCDVFVQDGYNDWFLPSFDELLLLYNNLHKQGKGSFVASVYASSSEDSKGTNPNPSINMLRLDFSVGYDAGTPKQGTYYVRPCRYF
jgi:hypothetical protein